MSMIDTAELVQYTPKSVRASSSVKIYRRNIVSRTLADGWPLINPLSIFTESLNIVNWWSYPEAM